MHKHKIPVIDAKFVSAEIAYIEEEKYIVISLDLGEKKFTDISLPIKDSKELVIETINALENHKEHLENWLEIHKNEEEEELW